MKQKLIALAVLGLCAGGAFAQSNVTIYGVVDTGYVKQSGRDVYMGTNQDNKIGFRGAEDLGGGLKATFELEKRFDLNDGSAGNSSIPSGRTGAPAMPGFSAASKSAGADWDGAANVGLSGDFGRVRFGRVNELSTETIRKFDPFNQYTVAAQILSTQRSARVSNTARYDSPKWSGFSFGALYQLGAESHNNGTVSSGVDYGNPGYAINLSYDNAGFLGTANWSRIADSNDSYKWNIGLGYKFGPARVTLVYEDTNNKGWRNGGGTQYSGFANKSRENNWLLGLKWDIGSGTLDASVQYARLKNVKNRLTNVTLAGFGDTKSTWKYGVGYTYNLSKRTSVYGIVSYTSFDDEAASFFYNGQSDRTNSTGVQIGMTHKF